MSRRSTTLLLHFCNFVSNSSFLRWHMSINVAKWFSFSPPCASQNNLFLALFPKTMLDLSQASSIACPLLLLHPKLSSLVAWEITCVPSKPFTCNVILMVFRLRRFFSLSRRFMRFHYTIINCFKPFLLSIFGFAFAIAMLLSFTRHRGSHRSFQFSSCVFENFWVFSIVWIKKNKFLLFKVWRVQCNMQMWHGM